MQTNEPFVIVWRAQTHTSPKVRNECFKRIRVHHPTAKVFVVWEEGVTDFSFVDERCSVCKDPCNSDFGAWNLFFRQRVGDSGLLLRDNLFLGSKPFPPFMSNQFFWTLTDNPAQFELRSGERVSRVEIPLYFGHVGYLRRSCLREDLFRMGPDGFSLALKEVVQIAYPNERPMERSHEVLDELVRLDVPVLCFITNA